MKLRPYQQKAIDLTYQYMREESGHPCIVMPTGSGKSHVIAELCRDALTKWPETRILMLVHSRELIEQNAEKVIKIWPNAPLGVYAAGLGRKEIDAITFGSIQSMHRKAEIIGKRHLLIIDESHLISHKEQGIYRKLINQLFEINPGMRIIGLTATPYRLGHGKITDGDAIFSELIEPVTIEELQAMGYLCRLRSRVTDTSLSVDGVHKRGGEYVESELQKAVDRDDVNERVVDDILKYSEGRKHWLIFCTGVDHSYHIRDVLRSRGITAETVTGETPLPERDDILDRFKAGKVKAVTNANVLTTGFDFPDIDLIGMLRPTMSPVLYVQQAGRGMRPKTGGGDCLVLDFAGVVRQHGPITMVKAPSAKGEGGIAPVKNCPECGEIIHIAVMTCPQCQYIFPPPPKEEPRLHDDDIQGDAVIEVACHGWQWEPRYSKAGNRMVVITYDTGIGERVREYLMLWNPGKVGRKALEALQEIVEGCGIGFIPPTMEQIQSAPAPEMISYKMDGGFPRILIRRWKEVKSEDVPF
jgi:DNA repair protein RadD